MTKVMVGLSTKQTVLQSLVKALRGQGYVFSFIFIVVWPCIYLLDPISSFALLVPSFVLELRFLMRVWQAARALGNLVNEITIQQFASLRKSCFAWHVAFSVFVLPFLAQGMEVNLFPGSAIYVVPGLLITSGICGFGFATYESRSWQLLGHLFETPSGPVNEELQAGRTGVDILIEWAKTFRIMSCVLISLSAGLMIMPVPAGPIGLVILFILNLYMVCTRGDGVSNVAKGLRVIIK